MALTHINPATLHHNPAFSQGVVIEPGSRLLIVGGQNGVDATGAVVGPGLGEQTVQALRNVLAVLHEVGTSQDDVARLTDPPCRGIRRAGGLRGLTGSLGPSRHRGHGAHGGEPGPAGVPRGDRCAGRRARAGRRIGAPSARRRDEPLPHEPDDGANVRDDGAVPAAPRPRQADRCSSGLAMPSGSGRRGARIHTS